MRVNNYAVSGDIKIDLNWYILGHQFAELKDDDQHQFLVGMLNAMRDWDSTSHLYQLDAIVVNFDKHSSDLKPKLRHILDSFSDRLQ